ncbi:hypothetical protein EMIHUDRAFT_455141 [Emiliania huxleyi CCMP1516]|uniref:Uncharacterized protein n=2 Tax=Emiliania huxleyi TaxID=2903 RepID=A0A0D3KK57_EMIH1|nr:hypothetical protein EMIHUDRAFT_455141 [Emiliania huxleyi CCMP1516]EOD36142.1 hypothetical protein EMIHUDRAFT_455141 [Emiliania huxleyi CCMP1516]|eukprot:XP_005788571.1 hypothetical protein EMIHUDRAFT_455141 [Emiliania huxleyi CCMP1516]
MSLVWKDQGWGNRKGTIVVRLMRRRRLPVEAVVAEDTSLFGVAPHAWEDGLVELDAAHPIVSQAEAGDTLSFLRNAGPLLAPPREMGKKEPPGQDMLMQERT